MLAYIKSHHVLFFFFFFNDTATTEIYTLSLHDALPIYVDATRAACIASSSLVTRASCRCARSRGPRCRDRGARRRSEEHTSELQSRQYLVCRLLLEKKKNSHREDQVMHVIRGKRSLTIS